MTASHDSEAATKDCVHAETAVTAVFTAAEHQ